MPYFKGLGGEWFDDAGQPALDSEAAIKATEAYLGLFQFSVPGTRTGSWDEATGAFRSGQVAFIIEAAPLGRNAHDFGQSQVVDKIGFAPPPEPLTGGGFAHGVAIGALANATDEERDCAGLFVACATSKENEIRRLDVGQQSELNRLSVIGSPLFAGTFGEELPAALAATAPRVVNYWQVARWPKLGNQWGILLEKLITGSRTDIAEALDELEAIVRALTTG